MSDYINSETCDFSNDASASSFGWNFQSNAGVFLFLKYIKEAKSIKIESKLQDIEIELYDGNKILDELVAADGVIFATPIYYGQMTAQAKTIIDRFYAIGQNPNKSLSGKAALIFTENQPEGTYEAYIELTKFSPFTFMGYEVIGHVDAGSAGPAGIVAEEQEDKLKEAYELGKQF